MLVHTVYFWLKPDSSEEEFHTALESLRGIEAVKSLYVGTPAGTACRPVVDSSFHFALTVVCDDVAGHDTYQVDPIHEAFVENFSPMFDRVMIFDAD